MRFATVLFALSLLAAAQEPGPPPAQTGHPVLAIGAPAPDFDLPGVDGKKHRLAEFQSSPIL